MPRLNGFKISIHTGDSPLEGEVKCKFNTHEFSLNNVEGGTGAGETLTGSFDPQSFVHGFTLVGPEKGTWKIDRVDMSYDTDEGPFEISFGPAVLDETNELNLWYGRPVEAWDV